MHEVGSLVVRATSLDADLQRRNDAFTDLVARFQDMAYACAYSTLGDRTRAEDVAQDAFLSAWLNLDRLRDPEAFAGWFRRIVLREASRAARHTRIVVPLDAAREVEAGAPGPELVAESKERQDAVQALLRTLPEHERLTVLLFYIGGHSQRDVAAFLGVSVTAVKQRLHSARQRLRRSDTAMISESLGNDRPSRNPAFSERLRARLRPFASSDFEALSALLDLASPAFPESNAEWFANRRRFDETGLTRRSYVAENASTGEMVGYGAIEQDPMALSDQVRFVVAGPATPTRYRLNLLVAPGPRYAEVVDALYERLEADARELNAGRLWLRDYVQEAPLLDAVRAHGFQQTRKVDEWALDVASWLAPQRPASSSEVAVTTLAQERASNPDYLTGLFEFWNTPASDATSQVDPAVPYTLAEIESRLSVPHVLPESYFIARAAGRIVAVLNLRRPPEATPARPVAFLRVRAGDGALGAEHRLLAIALDFARARGYHYLLTHLADQPPAPQALLQRLGFQRLAEMVVLEKELAPVKT